MALRPAAPAPMVNSEFLRLESRPGPPAPQAGGGRRTTDVPLPLSVRCAGLPGPTGPPRGPDTDAAAPASATLQDRTRTRAHPEGQVSPFRVGFGSAPRL